MQVLPHWEGTGSDLLRRGKAEYFSWTGSVHFSLIGKEYFSSEVNDTFPVEVVRWVL